MAIEDEVSSAVPSSFSSESRVHDEKREDLSPEDVAWIESCLIKESEISDGNWDSMQEALLGALNSEAEFHNSYESLGDESPDGNDVEMLTLGEHLEPNQLLTVEDKSEEIHRTPSNNPLPSKEQDESIGDEDASDHESLAFAGNPYLPSYIKGLKEAETTASGSDSRSSEDETEPSNEEIFRVWDLNVPSEENELGVQLKKILEDDENETQSKTSEAFSVSGGREEDLGVALLDDVIEAVSKISLSSDSSNCK